MDHVQANRGRHKEDGRELLLLLFENNKQLRLGVMIARSGNLAKTAALHMEDGREQPIENNQCRYTHQQYFGACKGGAIAHYLAACIISGYNLWQIWAAAATHKETAVSNLSKTTN